VQRRLLSLVSRAPLLGVAPLEVLPQAKLQLLLPLLDLQPHALELGCVTLFLLAVALPQLLFPLL
jgi:hypothetical protein